MPRLLYILFAFGHFLGADELVASPLHQELGITDLGARGKNGSVCLQIDVHDFSALQLFALNCII